MAEMIFPTELHKEATEIIKEFFLKQKNTDTILLVNSLARRKGVAESDIDIAVLVKESIEKKKIKILEERWQHFSNIHPKLNQYLRSNLFAQIHLDIIDGTFEPVPWENGGSVDFFEVEIGNRLLYSAPLTNEGEYFKKLKQQWLPYYSKTMQKERLKLSKASCVYDLKHIPVFVTRGLYFQAFDILYKGFQKFLQSLFIRHATYPIAYNKWIKEQVTDILKLPELYDKLPQIISVKNLESNELIDKAKDLHKLLEFYC